MIDTHAHLLSFKNVDEIVKLREKSKSSFVKNYRKHINNDATAYLLSDNLLFSTPDLLLDDGFDEDHNLAGVISYRENPRKTNAGKITTDFISDSFKFGLSSNRNENSVDELYKQAVSKLENNKAKEL